MPPPKFLQIHTLTSYPGTLLNRDDVGFAKRLPFGGVTRTRVSSQCLKYHWRRFEGEHALASLDVPPSFRSRRTFDLLIAQPLIDEGYPRRLVHGAVLALMERVLNGKKASRSDIADAIAPREGEAPADKLRTNQITVMGAPELRYLRQLAASKIDTIRRLFPDAFDDPDLALSPHFDKIVSELRGFSKAGIKRALRGLQLASGLDAAIFGRMATSDVLARGDAAVHVAHAITTHEEESESDYFSAVDQLKTDSGELGGGHINSSELTSGLFYGYVVIDLALLVSNITGCEQAAWKQADRSLAAEVAERMIHLIATVSPGAKVGSTAPYSYAQLLLAEMGDAQPRTLANAFQSPAPRRDVLRASYRQLIDYLRQMDQMYGQQTERRLAAITPADMLVDPPGIDERVSVPAIAAWAAENLRG